MAIETFAEYGDPVLRTRATATILGLLDEHPAAIREIKETLRIRVHVKELTLRSNAAAGAAEDAELRESVLAIKLDPGGRRALGFGSGAAAVVALMVLDGHSRARAAVRRAARAAGDARAAQTRAEEMLARHVGSLYHMLYPWALGSPAPDGVDHAEWTAALDRAIRVLFPAA
jgi:hypothetical protein